MKDTTHLAITGFLKIYDPVNNDVFFDGKNAIHYENMSLVLAYGLAYNNKGYIYKMAFGNGGTTVDPTGIITYLSPNNNGFNVGLYNQSYEKAIDSISGQNRDPSRNYIETRHVTGTNYSDIFMTCLLDYGEPSGQMAFDNSTNNEGTYVFDELGIKSFDPNLEKQLLLTHVIFHPVQKALNRLIQIDYTIRIHSLSGGT